MLFSRFDTQVSSSLPRNISVRGLRKLSLITAFFLAIRPTLQQGFFSQRKENTHKYSTLIANKCCKFMSKPAKLV
jgi:hypothetical protein